MMEADVAMQGKRKLTLVGRSVTERERNGRETIVRRSSTERDRMGKETRDGLRGRERD